MKANHPISKTVLASLLLALLAFGGCKNFMSNDSEFKANIQKSVDVANAAQVTVNVAPIDTSQGSTTPYPSATEKVDVPFTVTASAGSLYGFVRWASYIGPTISTETSGLVTFASPTSAITTATLNVARSDIFIRPIFERRPYVTSSLPTTGLTGAVKNAPICLYFNKPIADSSFTFDSGSTSDSSGEFKNVYISTTTGGTETSLATWYYAPVLSADKKKLTIKNKTSLTPSTTKAYKVKLAGSIVDTSGLTMGDDYQYSFLVGTDSDAMPPIFGTITGGLTLNGSGGLASAFGSDVNTRRVGAISSSAPLYLVVAGEDDPSSGSVDSVTIHDYYVTDATGAAQGDKLGSSTTTAAWSANAGTLVTVKGLSATTLDGLVKLRIDLEDANGNSTADNSTSQNYSFILDTTPPLVDSTQIARVTIAAAASGTAGFYNATAEVPFVPSTTSPLVDYGAASYRSSVVYYRFGFVESSFTNSLAWIPATTTAKIAVSGYTGNDNLSVPVYFQMKDDLGNTSAVTQLGTVAIDKTKPSGGIAATSVTTINSKQMLGSTSVPVTVSGLDVTSGIKSFYVAGGDGEVQPTAPTLSDADADKWIDYSVQQTSTATVSNTNGAKRVWVWFRDKADNVSLPIKDSQSLVLDTADPVVTRFYLSKATAFAANSTPAAQDKQYTNDVTLNFAFTASESTGIGSFSYSTDGIKFSKYFSAITTAAQTDADLAGYGVSLCNSVEISTGLWLVTGKLTVPATDGNKTMQIKVRDLVRTASEVTAYTTEDNITKVMFDATKPTLSGASLTATPVYPGSTYTYVGDDDVAVSYTADDAGSGLNTRSITGDLATAVADAILGATPAEQKAEGLKTVTKTENLKLSSVSDGAKNVTVTVFDWAGNSVYKTFQTYLDTTAPTFSVMLNANSAASITGTNSVSNSVLLFGPAQPSALWPSFYTYMATLVESGSGVALRQPMTLYRVTPAQVSAAVVAHTLTSTATGYSGSSVAVTPLTGYTANDNGTTLVTSANPVDVSYNFGKTITLPTTPTATATGKALSGYYVVGFKQQDNLGNTSLEQKIGYFYDQTPPVFTPAASTPDIFATNMDGTAGYLDSANGIYYVKESTTTGIVLRARATDRPASDADGSGIVKATVRVLNINGVLTIPERSTSIASGSITFNGGGTVIYETGDMGVSSFIVPNNDGAYNKSWAQSGNYYDVVLTDASGNFVTSAHTSGKSYTIGVMIDNTAPTMSYSFTMGGSNTLIGTTRYGNAPVITVSAVPSDVGSGAHGWALDTTATATAPISDAYWTTTDMGSTSALASALQTKINTMIKDNSYAPKAVYIHLIDNAGNIRDYGLDGTAGHLFKYDNVGPVFDSAHNKDVRIVSAVDGSTAFMKRNGAFFRTADNQSVTAFALAYVSDTRSETGTYQSGIYSVANTLSVINGTISGTTTSADVTTKTGDYDKGTRSVTYDNGSASNPVLVYSQYDINSFVTNYGPHKYLNLVTSFKDAAGNQSSQVTTNLYTDVTKPDSATVTFPAGYGSSTVFYKTAPTPTALTLTDAPFNATYQPASGVKGFVLTTSATAPEDDTDTGHKYDEWGYASAADCQTAFNTLWTGATTNGWYRYTGTSADFDHAQTALASILNNSSAKTVYIHVVDYAGNVYSPSTPVLSNAKLDTTPTTVASCKLYGTNTTATTATSELSYTQSATEQVAIMQFTEDAVESGLKYVTLTGNLDLTTMASTKPSVEYSSDGTAFSSIASTYSGGVINLTTSQTSGYLRITHLAFAPGNSGSGTDGTRTLTVVAQDAVQNVSSGASATKTDSITLDTVVPTASMWIKRSDGKGAQNATLEESDAYTTSQTVTIHVKYTEMGTGLSTLTFDGTGYSALSSITSVKTLGGDVVLYSTSGKILTLTGNPTGAGAELVITGFTVSTGISSSNTLTVTPKDYAGGSGAPASSYLAYDATPPTIESPAISNVKTNNSKYYVGPVPTVQPTVSATLGGQTHYLITTTAYSNNEAGYAAIVAGTANTGTSLSQSITANSYFNDSTTSQLHLYVTDDAGNVVGTTVGNPMYLDSTGPTGTISISVGTLDVNGYYYTNYYQNGSTYYGTALPAVTPSGATDAASGGVKYGTAVGTASTSVTLASGSNTIVAYDQLDNPGSSIAATGTVDAAGPTVTAANFKATGIVSSGNTTVSIAGTAGAVVEEGSGLRTITITGGLFTASTKLNDSSTGFTLSTDKTVLLLATPAQYSSSSTIALSGLAVTGSSDTAVHLTFADALGTSSSATEVTVDLPTASSTSVSLIATSGSYTSGGTLTFTPSESSWWKITTDGLETSGSWSGSTVAASSATSQNLPALSAAANVYLHLKDADGNIWVSSAISLGGTYTTDTTGPTPSNLVATNVATKSIITKSPDVYITNGPKLAFTMADDYCGSDSYIVSTLDAATIVTDSYRTASNSVNASGGYTWESLAVTGTGSTSSVTVPFIHILTTSAQTVYLHTKDSLGNIKTSIISYGSSGNSTQWIGDTAGPGLTYVSNTCNWLAGTAPLYYSNTGTVTFNVASDPAGIAGWTLSTSSSPGSFTAGTIAEDKTVNFPSSITTASPVYMCAKDALGNVSAVEISSSRTWLVDSAAPDATGMIASATGFYFKGTGAAAGTIYYKTNGASTLSVVNDPSDPVIVTGTPGTGIKGYGSSAADAYSSSSSTVPVGSSGGFFISDNVGNTTAVGVTHTKDSTLPAFTSSSSWSGTTSIASIATDTAANDSGLKSVSGITGSPATFAAVGTAGEYTITAEDNVGNQNKAEIWATTSGASLYINLPAYWTQSGSTKTTISGITAVCSSWKLTGTATDQGTTSAISFSNLSDGTYTLTLYTNATYDGNSIAVSFTTNHGAVSSIRVTGVSGIDDRLKGTLVSEVMTKKSLEQTFLNRDTEETRLVSWATPGLNAESASIVRDTTIQSRQSIAMSGKVEDSKEKLTLSSLHSLQLARAKARIGFVAAQNTDAAQNGADTIISPEIANNVKQDDGSTGNGVEYNQELVRIAQRAMAPLAEQYLARQGVQLDGVVAAALSAGAGQTASLVTGSPAGLPTGPGIGLLMPANEYRVFRRESGFGLVS